MLTLKSKTSSYKTVRKISKLKDCPYCKSELTETEKDFFPCTCSFQACVDCYKDMMKNKGVCPSCHSHLKFERLNALYASKREELSKDIESVQAKKSDKKSTTTITVVTTVSSKNTGRTDQTSVVSVHHHEEVSRSNLSKMSFGELSRLRIIQKNMIYVIGLAPQIAKSDILEKFEYFGQYGKVMKTIVNKNNVYNAQGPGGPSYSAYVSFSNEVEASMAILAVDEFMIYDRIIRASYGTTKYCTFFLRDKQCPNPSCLYLHTTAKEKDCFIKDDNISNKDIFNDQQRLALEHIQKHYQDVLTKANSGVKTKSILPSIKTVQEKVHEFIEENERLKVTSRNSETDKTEVSKSTVSPIKGEKEAQIDESDRGQEVEEKGMGSKKASMVAETISTNEETKSSQSQIELTSPVNEKEEVTGKNETKNEPNCQSHRSFSSTQSTTVNSLKKEILVDQKEEIDSRLSVKSPASIQKEVENCTQQEDIVIEEQANTEEAKSFINLADIFEKIAPTEEGPTRNDFNKKILDHLIRNLSHQSNSRFSIVQGDETDESEGNKTIEGSGEEWDSKNEEFSFLSKSIQEYLLSPASSPPVGLNVQTEKFSQHLASEENSLFGPSNYSLEAYPNFSTPTKKSGSTGFSNSKAGDVESADLESATTSTSSLQQEVFDKTKGSDTGMIHKNGKNANQQEGQQGKSNRRTHRGKGNKRQNRTEGKGGESQNDGNTESNNDFYKGSSPLLKGEMQNLGSYFGNISINAAESFYSSNNTSYNRIPTIL